MQMRIVVGCAVAHGQGGELHPGVAVQAEACVESRAQTFRVGERQGHQRGGHVARDVFEHDADLLRSVGRGVFGTEHEQGVSGRVLVGDMTEISCGNGTE